MSLSNKYYSHPDKSLLEHLQNVGINCQTLVRSKKINIEQFVKLEILADIAYIVGVCHDFGKFTSYFQSYIIEKDDLIKQKLKNDKRTHHSLISSLFTYLVVKDYLSKKQLSQKKHYEYLPVISFQIVRKHHGDLNDAIDDAIIDENNIAILNDQLAAINFESINNIYNQLFGRINYSCAVKKINNFIYDLGSKTFEGKRKLRNIDDEKTLFFYFITLLLYSILLDSDKVDAAQITTPSRSEIDSNAVDSFLAREFVNKNSKINIIRNEIYDEVVNQCSLINLEKDKILSLNLPTGSGKTLASFSFALKLRKRIFENENYIPKIIYSLPFLSIIDQNYSAINKVLDNPTSDIILKHHHLSDIHFTTKDNQHQCVDGDIGKDLLQIEGWNSEIIFTTFYQFFYSIITNKNRAVRKLHNIVNSIVLFDEVQAIPHKYWLLLKQSVEFFAEYFNTYFIFMTATQPLIVDTMKSLVPDNTKYFAALNRFNFEKNFHDIEINDFIDIVKQDLANNPKKDFLIVLNTIKSSVKVYEALAEEFEGQSKLYYLSTNIIPKLRSCLIKSIRDSSVRRKIIVSTQVVEAGVDLDADVVYRDFAPLDSLNQVAGRCNRNFSENKSRGEVKIFNIFSEENEKRYFPKSIYDKFLLAKTQEVFSNIDSQLEEKDLYSLTNSYFLKVNEGKSDNDSRKILESVSSLKFSELSEFKLIEQDYPTIDIFVEISKFANKTWTAYQQIKSDKNLSGFQKRNEFLKIRKQFNDYIISVPKSYAAGFEEGIINHVHKDELPIYYDLETGFKRDNAGKGTMTI